jgi:hypothetical protein
MAKRSYGRYYERADEGILRESFPDLEEVEESLI